MTALTLTRSGVRVGAYFGHGRLAQILYQGPAADSNIGYVGLSTDASGKYMLVNEELGSVLGWIRNGQLRRLLVHGRFDNDQAVAAAW